MPKPARRDGRYQTSRDLARRFRWKAAEVGTVLRHSGVRPVAFQDGAKRFNTALAVVAMHLYRAGHDFRTIRAELARLRERRDEREAA